MTDDHFHLESLEAFERDLGEASFRPVESANQARWRGPIHKAFASLTAATTMDILIVAGWPFRPPVLLVNGLDTNHSTLGGFVCMWQDGDTSREWETGEGFFSRIEEWCENAEHGWAGDDLGYDAFLNFQRKLPNVATFDRSKLGIHGGGWGDLHGVVNRGSTANRCGSGACQFAGSPAGPLVPRRPIVHPTAPSAFGGVPVPVQNPSQRAEAGVGPAPWAQPVRTQRRGGPHPVLLGA